MLDFEHEAAIQHNLDHREPFKDANSIYHGHWYVIDSESVGIRATTPRKDLESNSISNLEKYIKDIGKEEKDITKEDYYLDQETAT